MPSDRSLTVDSSFKCIPKSKGITVKALVRLRRSGICEVRFIERNHFFLFSFGYSLVKKLKHKHVQVYWDKLLLRGNLRFPVTSETAEKEIQIYVPTNTCPLEILLKNIPCTSSSFSISFIFPVCGPKLSLNDTENFINCCLFIWTSSMFFLKEIGFPLEAIKI